LKAAVYFGINDLRIMDIPTPKIEADEVLLRVKSCAICASEVRILKYGSKHVKSPRILGHELTGEVVEVGKNVPDIARGMNVVVYPNMPCGKCDYCSSGKYSLCESFSGLAYDLDGGFAEFLKIPSGIVKIGGIIPISSDLLMEASLAEPLSAVVNSVEKTEELLKGKLGFSAVVIGVGPMGLMHVMLLRNFSEADKIIAVDLNDRRLEYALKFGADETINASRENIVEKIMGLTGGRGVDATIVTVGKESLIEQVIKITRSLGVVNLFAGCPVDTSITLDPNFIHYGERIITGSYGSNMFQFKTAVNLIKGHKIPIKELITHKFKLDEIVEAFKTVMSMQGLKVVIIPSDGVIAEV